jgi:hypothetical protein
LRNLQRKYPGNFREPKTFQVWLGSLAAIIATGIIVQKIDYTTSPLAKHLAWAAHCSVLGAILAPLCFMGGPALMRAAWYTAGVVGGGQEEA